MKTITLTVVSLLTFTQIKAQDISPTQVPSIILNNFKTQFTNAVDIEWEMDGSNYNVEFEIGYVIDHEVWYSKDGNMVRHVEDVQKRELPAQVVDTLNKYYKGFRKDEFKRITHGTDVNYFIELNSLREEREVILNERGALLSDIAD